MVKKRDLAWILAYPLYQLIGTFRHEGSHALAGWLEGVGIEKFVFRPTLRSGSGLWWGYVVFSEPPGWFTLFAPYLVDLLTFLLFYWICMQVPFYRRSVWLNLVIFGLVSPLVNSSYNYLGHTNSVNDVAYLLDSLSDPLVHGYFWITIAGYLFGLWTVFRSSVTARFSQRSGRLSLEL